MGVREKMSCSLLLKSSQDIGGWEYRGKQEVQQLIREGIATFENILEFRGDDSSFEGHRWQKVKG